MPTTRDKPHLRVPAGRVRSLDYRTRGGGGGGPDTPPRPPGHGAALVRELSAVRASLPALEQRRRSTGMPRGQGTLVTFESDPGFGLALKQLDREDDGIALMSMRTDGNVELATVFVPEARLDVFDQILDAYQTVLRPQTQRPAYAGLVDSISHVRRAVLSSVWTDTADLPSDLLARWWEVWVRGGNTAVDRLRVLAPTLGVEVGNGSLVFSDRAVVLVHGTVAALETAVDLLDCVAEVRLAKELASFFTEMRPEEQGEWADSAERGAVWPAQDAPAVCILDTGANHAHPLLARLMAAADVQTVDPAWGAADHHTHGHGTAVAGLAGWGDLTDALGEISVRFDHRLESVKLLPPLRQTEPELFGSRTMAAVALAEFRAPDRSRVICITATTDDRDKGADSSWSAAIDALCLGRDPEDPRPRLVFLATGNVERGGWAEYPDVNHLAGVEDPGQAWNALTVGAFTEKASLVGRTYRGWTPIAGAGTLAPSSRTSVSWLRASLPVKPDLVMEGGNGARSGASIDAPDDLSLLTTHHQPMTRAFRAFGDTSAAVALAARMGARLLARYPDLWPETHRALLVHSARWTPQMLAEVKPMRGPRLKNDPAFKKQHKVQLLRRYGWGVPDLDRASRSAPNDATLISEATLQPFEFAGGRVTAKDWNLHNLPWPSDVLRNLGAEDVKLRVTLSYYIEPNPGRRGYTTTHGYASHALRFSLKPPGDSDEEFQGRISLAQQNEEAGRPDAADPSGWFLGDHLRRQGCVHSDSWTGAAADLADRAQIAVFPTQGWWATRPGQGRWRETVRYALLVSIETAETDIYSAISAEITGDIGVEIQ